MLRTADATYTARHGMSLLELIVAMAIFTIIMSSVMLIFNSVTNTVRRSYRTMDLFEATHGALLTIERDVQTAFSAPAIGADFHFYGEPNGFIFIGIAPDGKLGRLTYAVHVDTSRLENPHLPSWRGERTTLLRSRTDLEGRFEDHPAAFDLYYPGTSEYVEVEVELVYGLLTRYYESEVTNVSKFPVLEMFAAKDAPPYLPPSNFIDGSESAYRASGLPWFFPDLQDATNGAGVSRNIWEKLETVEVCHYWLQLLNGPPRIAPPNDWEHPLAIWRAENVFDQFWYDHVPFRNTGDSAGGLEVYPAPFLFSDFPGPDGELKDWRSFLWDHVMARDFVIYAWLLDSTGQRIEPLVNVINITHVFRYNVESGLAAGNNTHIFNTVFNLETDDNNWNNLAEILINDPANPELISKFEAMAGYRQFYVLGNPLQSRLPSAFEITLTVINPPVTSGAPTDMYTFAQTIHLPSGFLRRSLAVD